MANPVAQRIIELRAGAEPTQEERHLAVRLDSGERLRGEELALGMQVSLLLCDDPTYKEAVEAHNDAHYGRRDVEDIADRMIAGEQVSKDEVDAAIKADERRRTVTRLRLEATARRVRIPVTATSTAPTTVIIAAPRRAAPRTRRESHIARSSSSSDSGDSDLADLPGARLWRAIRRALGRP
jgi:hypothetical protein